MKHLETRNPLIKNNHTIFIGYSVQGNSKMKTKFKTAQHERKIVPSGYMSLMRHGLLVRLKYVEVVSVFTA